MALENVFEQPIKNSPSNYSPSRPLSPHNNEKNFIPSVSTPLPTPLSSRVPYTVDAFTASDEQLLLQEIESTLVYFIESGLPIFLEGIGIIFPKVITVPQTKILSNKFFLIIEKVRTIEFEKTYELIRLHKERFPGVIETKDLTHKIHRSVSRFLSIESSPSQIKSFIKATFKKLRDEIINEGQSSLFHSIGDFFALHNRQGSQFSDWYAGADIFLKARYQRTLISNPPRIFDRPTFSDSFEPFSAAYGPALKTETVHIADELTKLGYELSEEDKLKITPATFELATFVDPTSKNFVFVTNNLRLVGINRCEAKNKEEALGNEFIIQTPVTSATVFGAQECAHLEDSDIPIWPKNLILLGWILLQSSKTGIARPGAIMSFGDTPLSLPSKNFAAFLISAHNKMKGSYLTADGAFELLNMVLLTQDEQLVASSYGARLIQTFLSFKKFDQIIPKSRQSVVIRTSFAQNTQ